MALLRAHRAVALHPADPRARRARPRHRALRRRGRSGGAGRALRSETSCPRGRAAAPRPRDAPSRSPPGADHRHRAPAGRPELFLRDLLRFAESPGLRHLSRQAHGGRQLPGRLDRPPRRGRDPRRPRRDGRRVEADGRGGLPARRRRRARVMADRALPRHARAVVIGGGIIGCSTAYHLARLGWREVVLLERGLLSGGTTWHAAGLVGQLRSHANMTQLIRYSTELYAALEAETGQATGWTRCGSLSVARTDERLIQLKRTASMARGLGVEAEMIGLDEARRRWPLMRIDDLTGAVWLPGDGKANPADVTAALARGARAAGVKIFENVKVTGVKTAGGAAVGVTTRDGEVDCEVVVNCAGLWAREIGRLAGVTVPLHPVEHMYMVTKPFDGVPRNLPVMRDPDGHIYFKEEVGGIVMGGFEPVAKPWLSRDYPEDFIFSLFPEDWQQFEILMRN